MASQPNVFSLVHDDGLLRTLSVRTVSNSAPYLRPHIEPGMSILDAGCGPGSISIDMAKLVPNGRVVGIDSSPGPIEQARAWATQQGVTNTEFQVGDIHALEFPDDTFDIVHAHQVLQHVADPVQALREMRRVAKPGGIVAVRESGDLSWYPESPALDAFWKLQSQVVRLKGGNPHPGRYIHTWAKEAGFERSQITYGAGTWCFSTPEERAYWGGSMPAVFSAFSANAVEMNISQEDMKVQEEAWKDWVKNEDAWFTILNGEIICRKE